MCSHPKPQDVKNVIYPVLREIYKSFVGRYDRRRGVAVRNACERCVHEKQNTPSR